MRIRTFFLIGLVALLVPAALAAQDADAKKYGQLLWDKDYLDVLGSLVEAYEDVTIPMGPISDGDMIRSFLDSHRITQSQVAAGTGIAESTVSAVLAGKRKLNRNHIGKLAKYFHVSTAVFAD